MKTYKVTVNGTAYEITLEAVDKAEVNTAPAAASAPAPAAAPAPVAAPAQAPAAPAAAGGETVKSPMPGNILAVNVNNGDSVKKGQVLLILEAMKMENEIMAPCDGVVSGIVTKGSSVETGTVLCTLA